MAVAFRSGSTQTAASSTSVASIAINVPTGVQNGDLMLATITETIGSTASVNTPSGWSVATDVNATTNLGQWVFYKIANNESGSYTFALSTSTARMAGVMNAYTGVDNNNPLAGFASRSGTTTTTTWTAASVTQTAEVVYSVLCVATRNTTAALTISTVSSGYAIHGDTCSTTSAFGEAAIMDSHTTYGVPIVSTTPGTATLSGSSLQQSGITVFLRADLSTATSPASDSIVVSENNGSGVASPAFNTGYAEVIVAYVALGTNGNSTIADHAGLSWTKAVSLQDATNTTGVEIWWAYSSVALTNETVTVTNGAADVDLTVITYKSVLSTGPIGATNTASSTSGANASASLTTTGANSYVSGVVVSSSSTAPTAGTGNQIFWNSAFSSGTGHGWSLGQTANTASSGTSVTVNTTAPSSDYDMAIVEILSAVSAGPVGKDIQNLNNTLGANITQAVNRASTY